MKREFFIFAGLLIASVVATGCRNGQKEAPQPVTQAQPVPATPPQPTKTSLQSYFVKRTYTSRYNSPTGGVDNLTENTSGNVDGCSVHVIQKDTYLNTYDGETEDDGGSLIECTIDLSAMPDTAVKLVGWTPTHGATPQWQVQFDSACPLTIPGDEGFVSPKKKYYISFPSKSDAEQWRSGVLDAIHSNCRNGH